ncbi:uncharacterized protein LOC117100901 isoform X2 [Anneissia japonica]|uniref:uncharacterized protein LOC117100901 isoform X2 n=1 Tax=Anneissia japonica TaxID=1529436 RepID=UPI0014258E88|nr:uncharacterized protein LOC117100901 isoform X2 [Anneissia japonica]
MECEEREDQDQEESNALIREYTNCILQMEKNEEESDKEDIGNDKNADENNTLKVEDKTEAFSALKISVPTLQLPKENCQILNLPSIDPTKEKSPGKSDSTAEELTQSLGNTSTDDQAKSNEDLRVEHSVSSLTPLEVDDPLEKEIVPLKHWEMRNGNSIKTDVEKRPRKSRKSAIVAPNNFSLLVKEHTRSDTLDLQNYSPEAKVNEGVNNCCASLNSSDTKLIPGETMMESPISIRTFKERDSQENFILYGLLTPALCLVPGIDGHDALTKSFTELHGENRELKLAAAHIDDALSGRGKYGKARSYFKDKFGRWCFMMIESNWFNRLILFMTVIHLILTFLEPPGVDNHIKVVFVLTPVCLLVYALDVFVRIKFLSWRIFWTLDENKWTRVEFIFVCFYIIDFMILILEEVLAIRLVQPFRCLRAAIILCKSRNVGHIYDVVTSIVLKLGKGFLIIFTFIMLFSAVGVHLFMEDYQSIPEDYNCTSENYTTTETSVYHGAFNNVAITFLRLFVLLSTENYPEIMIPAYIGNHFSFFYFGIYLFVGVFFLTAILLAIIVDSYWEFAKKDVKKERARERAELAKAWNLLDPLGSGSLRADDSRFLKLFQMLRPKNTEEMNLQLISYLDRNSDGEIDSFEWTVRLSEALSFEFEETKIDGIDSLPKSLQAIGRFSRKIDRSAIFSKFILVLIFIHCLLFCIYWEGISDVAVLTIQSIKSFIVSIFFIELILRILAESKNLLDPLEILDIILIIVAIVSNIVWYVVEDVNKNRAACTVVSGLAVFFRLGFNLYQTKKLITLFTTRIFPVMFDLIVLVFIIIYFYAIIGFESFSGRTRNPLYSSSHYDYCCGLGFDTFSCALLVIFQIVTTSNWHEIMNSVMKSTSDFTCIYFVTCYIVINLVVMNLFVAIAIEAFNKLGTEKELEAAENKSNAYESGEQDKSALNSAKTFLNNIFESSRVEEEKERNIRPTNSPRMRRPSRVSIVHQNPGMSPLLIPSDLSPVSIEDEDVDEDDDKDNISDLKHLTPKERREQILKRKRAKKKKKKLNINNPKTKIEVVTAYRGTKDQELDLIVGDEVQIIQKQDDWWEGKIRGRKGWFPASHVREVKRKPVEQSKHEIKVDEKRLPSPPTTAWTGDPVCRSTVPTTNPTSATPANNGVQRSQNPLAHRYTTPHTNHTVGFSEMRSAMNAVPKLRVKNKGDWRREILGDITVMNPEELKELNKIFRSGSLSGASNTLPIRKPPSMIVDSIVEEEEPPPVRRSISEIQNKPKFKPPVINFERAPTMDLAEEDEDESTDKTDDIRCADALINHIDTLTVEKPELPSDLKKKKQKEKTKPGEMPAWMQNFVASKHISIVADQNLEEGTKSDKEEGSKSDKDEGSLLSIPGLVNIDDDTAV